MKILAYVGGYGLQITNMFQRHFLDKHPEYETHKVESPIKGIRVSSIVVDDCANIPQDKLLSILKKRNK